MLRPLADYFSADYRQARDRFNAVARAEYYEPSRYFLNLPARDGGEIFVDVARYGQPDASRVLITTSGTHGVEGFAGSAIQLYCLENRIFDPIPRDMAIVHVHALNPYGFSFLRRTNEHNVDINRNCLEWRHEPPPRDPEFTAKIQPLVHPPEWQWPIPDLVEFRKTHDKATCTAAIAGGQYSYNQGLFYGGRGVAWSTLVWISIIEEHLRRATDIAHIDFHTGLGSYGHGELIVPAQPGETMLRLARIWWGHEAKSPFDGTSAAGPITGFMNAAIGMVRPAARTVSAALEFGTYAPDKVLEALAFDNYVSARPRTRQSLRQYWEAKDMMKETFCPSDPAWKEQVVSRSADVLLSAMDNLLAPRRRAPE
ncbi:MAG TPA: DUF2817 domain-containing protein [Alphaproteobacteria bacterium]|jgi:hypothetical protein